MSLKQLTGQGFDYSSYFDMVHTRKNILALDNSFLFPNNHKVTNLYSKKSK